MLVVSFTTFSTDSCHKVIQNEPYIGLCATSNKVVHRSSINSRKQAGTGNIYFFVYPDHKTSKLMLTNNTSVNVKQFPKRNCNVYRVWSNCTYTPTIWSLLILVKKKYLRDMYLHISFINLMPKFNLLVQ